MYMNLNIQKLYTVDYFSQNIHIKIYINFIKLIVPYVVGELKLSNYCGIYF